MQRCELSDLPVSQCGCRIHKPGQAVDQRPTPMIHGGFSPAIVAQFPGRCGGGCARGIVAGEHIRRERLRPENANAVGIDGAWWCEDCTTARIGRY